MKSETSGPRYPWLRDGDGAWRWISALPLLVLALAAVGCGARGEKAAQADTKPKPVPVTVAPVERRSVERTVEVVGTLKGWEDVTIGSKRPGRVARVLHDMGDRVEPGAPLVELETVDSDLAISQAEKQLAAELAKLGLTDLPPKDFDVSRIPAVVQARVALDRARQNLDRQRTLNQRRAGTQQDLQNAENDEAGAQAALDKEILLARATLAGAQATRAALEVSRQARADMVIRAPRPSTRPDGHNGPVVYQVTKRSVSEGQMLKDSDPVVALIVEDPLRLWASVPQRFSAEVRPGQPARVRVDAYPDQTFAGKVARINPAVDPISRTFQVEVSVPNPKGLLRPGGFAKASISTQRGEQAVTVPMESIVRFAGVTKLFVVRGNAARAVNVETGLEGPGWVEVLGDLPADAPVVLTGQAHLADDTPVTIRKPEKPEAEAARTATPKGL